MGIFQIVFFSFVACAVALPTAPKIVGGQTAARHQFPHQALVQWPNGRRYCGGALIHERWVLTAGHCKTNPEGKYEIFLGMLYQDETHEDVQRINASRFITHPDYAGGWAVHDIALVELETPARITKAVQIAALPSKENCNSLVDASVSGWGNTSPDSGSSHSLQWASMPRVSLEVCKQRLIEIAGSAGILDDTMICTIGNAGKNQTTCSGDSGGPLVLEQNDAQAILVGIVSWGVKPCGKHPTAPSVYTNVCSHLPFINEYVA